MNLADLRDQLIIDEGLRLRPYRDSVGKLTIGVGRNLDDVGISNDEAMVLLDHDIEITITLTLESASSVPGRELTIRTIQAQTVVSASSNVVPLIGGAAGTAILAATAGKWALLKSDGTNWQIMAGN